MASIALHYLKYEPVTGHRESCTKGPDTWQVAQYVDHGFGSEPDPRSTSLRMFCPECKTMRILTAAGPVRGEFTLEPSGWGSEPERVAGLWLWAGPPLLPGDPPDCYYVTTHKLRPNRAGQIAGVIGSGRASARANAALRWFPGLGCTDYGSVRQAGPESGFSSKTAAAKWIAAQLADRREA